MPRHNPEPADRTYDGASTREVRQEITPSGDVVRSAQFTSTPSDARPLETADTERPFVSVAPGCALRPPPVSDEFRIIEHLGSGGMGDVYLAHDASLDRRVAMKFLRDVDDRPDSKQRFVVEARAAARIQHPNVLTVHRVGEVDGRPYLVTEYIEGKGLDRIAKPVHWKRTLEIGLGLARGLAEAHRHGVLHRDIKPSNAILGKDGHVKLVDFGLAKLVKRPSTSSRFEAAMTPRSDAAACASARPDDAGTMSLTNGGAMLGTPAYMAPELWSGESATERSDIYSLGALLFELCTGDPPHKGVPPVERKHREAPSLAALVPSLDPRLAAIIQRCLRKDPSARYATGDALREALERLARGSERAGDPPACTLRSVACGANDDELCECPERPFTGGNPYRGLRTFEAEHRALFFGRRAEIGTLLGRLRVESLVVVEGEYGVGKSSLCRAGVLPSVEDGALRENRAWSVARVMPGPAPLLSLGAALAPQLGTDARGAVRRLRARRGAIAQDLRRLLGSRAGVVLFVDQLEELVTVGDPEGARIVDDVLGQLAMGVPGVRLLVTVNSAFLDALASLPWLGEQIGRASYLLKPMSPEGVREAITGPALMAGVRFDSSALVEMLVEEALQSAWGLPLLQFVLAELWEARDPETGAITDAAMARLGDGASALARYAEGVLRAMSADRRAAARRVVTRLAGGGDAPARREDELVAGDPAARIALHELSRGRLVAVRGAEEGVTYELVHDALREDWTALRCWLDEQTEGQAVRVRLEAAAMEWRLAGSARARLWGAREIAEIDLFEPGALSAEERAFLAASRREQRRARVARAVSRALVSIARWPRHGGRHSPRRAERATR